MSSERKSCVGCDCYDEDMGCTMPDIHKSYACSLEDKDYENCEFKPVEGTYCMHEKDISCLGCKSFKDNE